MGKKFRKMMGGLLLFLLLTVAGTMMVQAASYSYLPKKIKEKNNYVTKFTKSDSGILAYKNGIPSKLELYHMEIDISSKKNSKGQLTSLTFTPVGYKGHKAVCTLTYNKAGKLSQAVLITTYAYTISLEKTNFRETKTVFTYSYKNGNISKVIRKGYSKVKGAWIKSKYDDTDVITYSDYDKYGNPLRLYYKGYRDRRYTYTYDKKKKTAKAVHYTDSSRDENVDAKYSKYVKVKKEYADVFRALGLTGEIQYEQIAYLFAYLRG